MFENFLNKFFALDFTLLTFFVFLFALLFFLTELVAERFKKIPREFLRKSAHILSGVIFIFATNFVGKSEIIILATALTFAAIFVRYFDIMHSLHKINRFTFGTVLFPFSVALLAFFYLPLHKEAFLFGLSVLAFSDAMAAIAGEFEKKKIPFFKKTIFGSFVFFLTTFVISLAMLEGHNLWTLFALSIFLTSLEFVLIFGFDNLVLPLAAAYLFYLLF